MYIYIYMVSINISLKKEAYKRLQTLKRSDESFSDEILRLTKKSTGADLLECFGVWKDLSADDIKTMEKAIEAGRTKTSEIVKKWEE